MKGYYKPEANAEAITDGWFRSGDGIATIDADGYYFIVDRKKDMLIRGGFNVYPREVEEVLYAHPAIAEAAVIGVPHPSHGEEVKAVVALKPGASATPDEIIAYTKQHLAAYKYPRIVEIVAGTPRPDRQDPEARAAHQVGSPPRPDAPCASGQPTARRRGSGTGGSPSRGSRTAAARRRRPGRTASSTRSRCPG